MRRDPPGPLTPTNCSNASAGVTYPGKVATEIGPCAGSITADSYDPNLCPWFKTPEKPSPDGGGSPLPALPVHASGAPKLTLPTGGCRLVGTTLSCDGLLDRP